MNGFFGVSSNLQNINAKFENWIQCRLRDTPNKQKNVKNFRKY